MGRGRGAAQTFLAAAVGEVHLPFIQEQRNSTQRGDRVEQEQTVVLTAEITNAIHGLANPSGRFSVNQRKDGWLVLNQGRFEFFKRERFPQGFSTTRTSAR